MDLNQKIQLTHEQLKTVTFGIQSLNQEQRELIRQKLEPQVGHTLWARELKALIHELRDEHKISAIDAEGIINAFFPS